MAALPDLPPTGHKSCTRATLDIREAPLLCAVTVANIGQAGLAWLETETDYEKIWIPQNTEAWRNKQVSPPPLLPPRLTAPLMVLCSLCVAGGAMQVFEAHFPQSDGRLMVIIKATDGGSGGGGSNMLTKPRLQLAQAVHELVVSEPGCACTPRADRHDLNDSLSWPHQIPRPLRACVSRRPVRSVVAPCSLELLGGHVGFCEPYCRPGTDQHTVRPGAAPPTNSHCHCHCYCHLPLPLPLLCPPDPPTITHTHQWPCCAPLRYKLIAASPAQVLRRPIVRSVVVGGTGSGGAATALQMAFLLERGVDSASEELVSEWESRVLRRLEGAAAAPAITTPGVVMCCTCRNFLNTHL